MSVQWLFMQYKVSVVCGLSTQTKDIILERLLNAYSYNMKAKIAFRGLNAQV